MDPKFVKKAVGDDERKRFGATVDLFASTARSTRSTIC